MLLLLSLSLSVCLSVSLLVFISPFVVGSFSPVFSLWCVRCPTFSQTVTPQEIFVP